MRIATSGRRLGLAVLLMTLVAGCGPNELESPTAVKLKALANFYLELAVSQKGKGPANEAALKKHMRSIPGFVLQANGVEPSAIDGLFTSERDGEPFVVLYGTSVTQIKGDSTQLIAHEKTGKGGKRLVVYASTKVDLVDDARLQQLAAAAGK